MNASRSILTSVAVVTLGFCLVYMMARIMTLHRRIMQLEAGKSENELGDSGLSVQHINELIRTQLEEAIKKALKDDENNLNVTPAAPARCHPSARAGPTLIATATVRPAFAFNPVVVDTHSTNNAPRHMVTIEEIDDEEGVEETKNNNSDPPVKNNHKAETETETETEHKNLIGVEVEDVLAAATAAAKKQKPTLSEKINPADVFPRSTTNEGDGAFTPPPPDISSEENAPPVIPSKEVKARRRSGRAQRSA